MDYAAGFYLSDEATTKKLGYQHIALIRKKRPDWQAGRLNAIGGKLEQDEKPNQTMAREFQEETGVETRPGDWNKFAILRMPGHLGAIVHFFIKYGNPSKCKTTTDEEIVILPTKVIVEGLPRSQIISNLKWLLPLSQETKIWPVEINYRPHDFEESPD